MDEEPLRAFGPSVLGRMQPRCLLVSTPNIEYNTAIRAAAAAAAAATDGTTDAADAVDSVELRNSDHRFEWTRDDFRAWADSLAVSFGYSVSFDGVGVLEGAEALGHATQVAVFERKDVWGNVTGLNPDRHCGGWKDVGGEVREGPYELLWTTE